MVNYNTVILIFFPAVLAVLLKKLTLVAGITGFFVALFIYLGAGYPGLCFLAAFFICGVIVTGWKVSEKTSRGISEENKGRRKASQVLANGGMAAIISLAGFLWSIDQYLISILVASAFSAATADTLSSELGNVYGKRYYNIITFKPDRQGLDGVVSLEGTFAGLIGSLIIASIFFAFYNSLSGFLVIIVAGTAGNIADSLMGATLERKGRIGNDVVNFFNTTVGVVVGYLLA